MSLFDINAGLGRVAASPVGFDDADALEMELKRLRIDEALVYHTLAAEDGVELGNRLLIEAVRGHDRLHACWVMAPPTLGDLPEPAEWVRRAVEAGVRAVRMFPRHSVYTFAEWCVGGLLSEIEKAGLPLLLDFGPHHWSERVIPWADVANVCGRRPGLNVVVVGVTTGETRDVVSLLARTPNLHIECHAFGVPDGLRRMAEKGLGSRLTFGTGLPYTAGECAVHQAIRAGLGADEAQAFLSGNARRMLGLSRAEGAARLEANPVPAFGGPVIDIHGHIGAWERTTTSVRTPAETAAMLRRYGIDKMIVSSFAGIHGETRVGNRQTAEATRDFPGILYGYAVVNPHYPDETVADLSWCFDQARGFVGLKLHCGLHAAPLEHAGYEWALSFANERGLPALVHEFGDDDWETLSRRFPNVSFIVAHGCAWNGHSISGREKFKALGGMKNVHVDVAGSAAHRGALRALVDLVGATRVLCGSDFPMFDLSFATGRVLLSELETEEKTAILGGNALRVFRLLR